MSLRKAGTAFAIGPRLPIILCAPLAYEELGEQKVADAAGAKEEPSDKLSEVAPARF